MVIDGRWLFIGAKGAGTKLFSLLLSIGGFWIIAVHCWRLLDESRLVVSVMNKEQGQLKS